MQLPPLPLLLRQLLAYQHCLQPWLLLLLLPVGVPCLVGWGAPGLHWHGAH
jgi:hypothetical protein